MGRNLVILSLASAELAVWGRPAEAQTVSLEEAMQRLNRTLATIPHVSHADLVSDESGPRYRAARDFIRERQCASRTANPMVALAQPASISLRGTVDQGRAPQVTDSFELPIRVSPLSELPNEYLRNVKVAPSDDPAKIADDLRQNYFKLNSRVSALVGSFELLRCPVRRADAMSAPPTGFFFIVPTY